MNSNSENNHRTNTATAVISSTCLAISLTTSSALADLSNEFDFELAQYETAPPVTNTFIVPSVPTNVEICLVTDVSGSFGDDIDNLNQQIGSIVGIVRNSETAMFGLATFADYPQSPYGGSGDRPYTLVTGMTNALDWRDAVSGLTIDYGDDYPESQLDAIYGAVNGLDGWGGYCGFTNSPQVTRFIISSTDSGCHSPGPGKPHLHTVNDVVETLTDNDITFLGLAADSGARNCYEPLAQATGGSVDDLYEDGSNIQYRLRNAVAGLDYDIEPRVIGDCPELAFDFEPALIMDALPGSTIDIQQSVTLVRPISDPVTCTVSYAPAGTQTVTVYPGVGDGSRPAPPHCSSYAADTDGDGWGWEHNRTCIIENSEVDKNRRVTLPTCSSPDLDSDNDGYGWENEASCVVTAGVYPR